MKCKFNLSVLIFFLSLGLFAQAPAGYYSAADGKKAAALKTALSGIISGHTVISYDGLYDAYEKTDCRADGKVWDIYSDCTNFDFRKDRAGSYKKEGDCYNREHSFPKSWFNEGKPMYSDIFHVIPTDGYVNNRRGNFPYGETDGGTYKSHGSFSKVGPSKTEGYSGTVFEPNDEYKGDVARSYFYMATRYESNFASWKGDMLAGNKYPCYKEWAIKMLLRWAKEDPVSQKEIDRNNAVYEVQENRNPFIDYPGLEQYIWGSAMDWQFSSTNYVEPTGIDPGPPPTPPTPPDTTDTIVPPTPIVEGELVYMLAKSEAQLFDGAPILVVCPSANRAMGKQGNNIRDYEDVVISDGTIVTEVGRSGKPYALILRKNGGCWNLYDPTLTGSCYLGLTSSDNKIHVLDNGDTNEAQWNITISSGGVATIKNVARSSYSIRYNEGSPRFACYKSGQKDVQIFVGPKPSTPTGLDTVLSPKAAGREYQVAPNIYIINGQKVLKR